MNKQGEHGIGWCDYTWNPITGCLNHVDGLCKGGGFPCYAYKLAHGRLRRRYLANPNRAHWQGEMSDELWDRLVADPFYPRIWPKRFKDIKARWGSKIFLNDMSDWMGPWIPAEWKMQTIDFIRAHPQYIFQTLTKQPQELDKWEFPENCWVGGTATGFHALADAHYYLSKIDAKTKFLSIEPFLSWGIGSSPQPYPILYQHLGECSDWLIIGACTGTKTEMSELVWKYPDLTLMPNGNRWTAQPKIEWVSEIVEAADKAGIPVFLKENLRPLLENDPLNRLYWANVHDDERGHERADDELRQEFPKEGKK